MPAHPGPPLHPRIAYNGRFPLRYSGGRGQGGAAGWLATTPRGSGPIRTVLDRIVPAAQPHRAPITFIADRCQ